MAYIKRWEDKAEEQVEVIEKREPLKRHFEWLIPPGVALFLSFLVAGFASLIRLDTHNSTGVWGTASIVLIFVLIAYTAAAFSISEYVNTKLREGQADG